MRRRVWLAAAASAVLAFPAPQAPAAGPELRPLSVDEALDQLETLIAPEALAAFYAAPEDDVRELWMGVWHMYLSRDWSVPGGDGHIPSLNSDLRARQVPASQDYQYLLTTLWRRKHGLPLDTPLVLESIDRQERLRAETIRTSRFPNGPPRSDDLKPHLATIDHRETRLWMRLIHFDKGSVRSLPDDGAVDHVVKAIQSPASVCALAQVQGHASADESDARALSLRRARAIVARLVQRGVAPARLAAHGLGTRFPASAPKICPTGVPLNEQPTDCISPRAPAAARAPARDRRVEIFCLRRHWVPPLVDQSALPR